MQSKATYQLKWVRTFPSVKKTKPKNQNPTLPKNKEPNTWSSSERAHLLKHKT